MQNTEGDFHEIEGILLRLLILPRSHTQTRGQ